MAKTKEEETLERLRLWLRSALKDRVEPGSMVDDAIGRAPADVLEHCLDCATGGDWVQAVYRLGAGLNGKPV